MIRYHLFVNKKYYYSLLLLNIIIRSSQRQFSYSCNIQMYEVVLDAHQHELQREEQNPFYFIDLQFIIFKLINNNIILAYIYKVGSSAPSQLRSPSPYQHHKL